MGLSPLSPSCPSSEPFSGKSHTVPFRRLSIIIPVYNEETTVLDVVERVIRVPLQVEKEIIVVDDGSTDATPGILDCLTEDRIAATVLAAPPVAIRTITSRTNAGKGSAVRLGLNSASGEYILIQDADKELSPEEIPRLLEPLLRGDADVVLGSRLLRGRQTMFRYTYVCNRLLNGWANLLYRSQLTDVATGYKVFPRQLTEQVRFLADGFEWDVELIAHLHRLQMRIVEVPISYDARTRGEGKQITFWDGIISAWTLFRLRLQPRAGSAEP